LTSNFPKCERFFLRISALASKIGQTKKIKAHYSTNNGVFNVKSAFVFDPF
jgi:hypothetical protein